jgi:hypothetical protein
MEKGPEKFGRISKTFPVTLMTGHITIQGVHIHLPILAKAFVAAVTARVGVAVLRINIEKIDAPAARI